MVKKEICIVCQTPTKELSGWDNERYLSFAGTRYAICYPCFEKLSLRFGAELKYYWAINTDEPQVKNTYKKKISSKIRKEVYERDQYRCVYCGSFKDLTLDHVYPESLGGESTVDNLVTACNICNATKGAKTDWQPQLKQCE